jgi:hypothetical protein
MPYYIGTDKDLGVAADGTGSFVGGQWSLSRANLIPDNAFADGLNLDINRDGEAETRRGVVSLTKPGGGSLIQGMCQHKFSDNGYYQTVVSQNADLYRYNDASPGWGSEIGAYTGSTGDKQVEFASLEGILYIVSAGTALTRIDSGTTTTTSGFTGTGPTTDSYHICEHTHRIVVSGVDNKVYFSQFLDGKTWDLNKWVIRVGAKSDPIHGILSWTNSDLLVFKRHSIYLVSCEPTYAVSDFEVKPIHKSLGTFCNKTACQVGDDVFVLCPPIGVVRIARAQGTDQQNSIDNTDPVSRPIENYIKMIDWSAAFYKASAYYWNHRYFLSVPISIAGVTIMTTFVYNTVTESWCGSWGTNWNAICFTRTDNDYIYPARLRIGCYDGNVYEWDDYTKEDAESITQYRDNGVDLVTTIYSKGYQFDEPKADKYPVDMTLEFNRSSATAAIGIIQDAASIRPIVSGLDTTFSTGSLVGTGTVGSATVGDLGAAKKNIDLTFLPPANENQIVIQSTANKLRLRSIQLTAMVGSSGAATKQ